MYKALMGLVEIHAQISRVAENLLERGLNALVEDVAEEGLVSFKQVKRFGMVVASRMSRSPPLQHYFTDKTSSTGYTRNRVHAPKLGRYVSPRREDAFELYNKICSVCTNGQGMRFAGI